MIMGSILMMQAGFRIAFVAVIFISLLLSKSIIFPAQKRHGFYPDLLRTWYEEGTTLV
jgi:hypothetical protein